MVIVLFSVICLSFFSSSNLVFNASHSSSFLISSFISIPKSVFFSSWTLASSNSNFWKKKKVIYSLQVLWMIMAFSVEKKKLALVPRKIISNRIITSSSSVKGKIWQRNSVYHFRVHTFQMHFLKFYALHAILYVCYRHKSIDDKTYQRHYIM